LALGITAAVVLLGGGLGIRAALDQPAVPFQQGPLGSVRAFVAAPPPSATDRRIGMMREILRQDPANVKALTQLGLNYLQKARETGDPSYYGRAEEAFTKALVSSPQDVDALDGMGTLALARHRFVEALDWGERARAANPDRAYSYGVLGDAYLELGDYDRAIEHFQAMMDRRPDLGSYSRASYARELYGDIVGAIEAMQMAVRAGGPSTENANWARVQLGNLYFLQGDLDAALREYQTTLQIQPDYVHGEAGVARVLAARGDLQDAIERYRRVVERLPWVEYVVALGDLYQAAGQPEEARRQYDLVRAIAQLQRANGVNVDLEMTLFDLDHDQNLPEALAQAERLMATMPSIRVADLYAWALYRNGRAAEALPIAQKALRLGTRDPLMLYHAGAIAAAAGQPDMARGFLEQALARNPHFSPRWAPEAQRLLVALGGSEQTASSVAAS